MAKLVKGNDWVAQLKGKGVTVIDNTGTVPEVVSKPMPVRDKDRGKVENGKVKRTQVVPMSEVADTQARQDEVDAALERSKAAHADETVETMGFADLAVPPPNVESGPHPDDIPVEFVIEPSDPVSFADLAGMAQAPEIFEEQLAVVTTEKVFDSTEPQSWDDLVAGTLTPEQENVPDFPPETPIVCVSLDVPKGVELVVKINGQEIL